MCLYFRPSGQEHALPGVPKTHPAREQIAAAIEAWKSGAGDVAIKRFNAASDAHNDLPPGEVMFAHVAFAANKGDIGHKALQMAAISHPDDPEVWNMLADLASRSGRLAESQVLFQKALGTAEAYTANADRQKSQMVNARAGLALTWERRSQWDAAESELRAWLELEPKNSSAWRRLAGVFFQTKRYDMATETLTRLRSFDQNQPVPELTMGLLYQQTGQTEKAVESMNAAIETDGDSFATRMAVARWATTAGKKEMLAECLAKAEELKPQAPTVQILKGMLMRFEGKSDQAETIFRELLTDNPASFDVTNGLALSLLEQGDEEKHKQAVQHAQVNAQRHKDLRVPRSRSAAATFAWALFRTGRTAEATKLMQNIVQSGEISPEVGYFAAEIFHASGKSRLATELLKASLASTVAFPQKQAAQQLLVSLQKDGA